MIDRYVDLYYFRFTTIKYDRQKRQLNITNVWCVCSCWRNSSEIYEMQARAIFEATTEASKKYVSGPRDNDPSAKVELIEQ